MCWITIKCRVNCLSNGKELTYCRISQTKARLTGIQILSFEEFFQILTEEKFFGNFPLNISHSFCALEQYSHICLESAPR